MVGRRIEIMDADSTEEFVRLFSKGQLRILGFVHTLVANLPEAEDILQETSAILWKKWPEFEKDRDFVKWACGIARFEVFRMLRENKRRTLYLSVAVLNQIADVAMAKADHSQEFEDSRVALAACLRQLQEAEQNFICIWATVCGQLAR